MAKAKKAARNIVVNDVKYRWRATGNDGWISLTIWPDVLPGATIHCMFDYDQTLVPRANGVKSAIRQLVITGRIVRRVIDYAMRARGYDAAVKATQLELGRVDGVIDRSDAVRSS